MAVAEVVSKKRGGETGQGGKRGRRPWSLERRESVEGWLWSAPWWVGFLLFAVYPMVSSFYHSFTKYKVVGTTEFVGLANYVEAISGADRLFWPSLGRTAYYTSTMVPLALAGSLMAALILNRRIRGTNVFRTIFHLPSLMPGVALAVIWMWILNPKYGLVNQLLNGIGITGPGWLSSVKWAVPGLLLMGFWGSFGGAAMLIFLASLQSIPVELYEVAQLDGANALHKFWYVTVPMLSPAIMYNSVMGIIYTFQSFQVAYLTTQGGPQWATWFFGLHIYTNAFEFYRMGYASALSWCLFLVVLLIVFVYFKLSGRWVFMAGEGT